MKKEFKFELIVWLVTVGVFAILQLLWMGLEFLFYGAVQPSIVDTIIGVFIVMSIYFNVLFFIEGDD